MNKYKILTITVCALAALFLFLIFTPAVNVKYGEPEERLNITDTDVNSVLDSIKSKKTICSSFNLPIAIRLTGFFQTFKQGSYKLTDGMSTLSLINKLVKGRQDPVKLTFNNIRTKQQLCDRISSQLQMSSEDLCSALCNDSILKSYDMDSLSILSIFLPDTYEVYWNIKPSKLINKLHSAYEDFWTPKRIALADSAKISPFQASILASIVEEESNLKSEQPTIAGLYLNRLHTGMKLQADPTVKFATGDFSLRRITLKHINDTRNNHYNTYTHMGLPPGLIRIPAKSTIDAVLNYEPHKFMFMCAKGNGQPGHDFTVTFSEHKRNAAKYQNNLNKKGIH